MNVNLWAFLSICVVFPMVFAMFVLYLGHKKTMKQLEIEVLKQSRGVCPEKPLNIEEST